MDRGHIPKAGRVVMPIRHGVIPNTFCAAMLILHDYTLNGWPVVMRAVHVGILNACLAAKRVDSLNSQKTISERFARVGA